MRETAAGHRLISTYKVDGEDQPTNKSSQHVYFSPHHFSKLVVSIYSSEDHFQGLIF